MYSKRNRERKKKNALNNQGRLRNYYLLFLKVYMAISDASFFPCLKGEKNQSCLISCLARFVQNFNYLSISEFMFTSSGVAMPPLQRSPPSTQAYISGIFW